eukprot:COSAG04_NODE_13231_length_614_cov_1.050485_1_plen_157_part_10
MTRSVGRRAGHPMWARLAALAALAPRAESDWDDSRCPSIRRDHFDCADVECSPTSDDKDAKGCVCCCGLPPRSIPPGPGGGWAKSCAYEAPCCAADAIPAVKCDEGRCEQFPNGLDGVMGQQVPENAPSYTCHDEKGEFSGTQPGHWFTAACPPGYV